MLYISGVKQSFKSNNGNKSRVSSILAILVFYMVACEPFQPVDIIRGDEVAGNN